MQTNASRVLDTLPEILKNIADWTKNNFDENAQEILDNSSGTAGILIKFFGKSIIDKYFDKLEKDKLENFGEKVYLKSAFIQANNSISKIENELDNSLKPNDFSLVYRSVVEEDLKTFTEENLLLIFQPEYHPSIVFVKNNFWNLLKKLGVKSGIINKFLADFNSNISIEVEKNFGKSYDEHLKQISEYALDKNEAKLLWETSKLGIIGFTSNENLKYEETYGIWQDVHKFKNFESQNEELNVHDEETENALKPALELIDEYFKINPQNNLEKILFVVADFGKGKSVFLKHYAAKLAKNYIKSREGEFPIYFNLRNFHNYSQNTSLGVIEDYLLTEYAIDIKSPVFRKKKFVFLIDSLDESGELNETSIKNVVNSIKQIQNIDKQKYRTNKIIITTRPFDEGLDFHLREHKPKTKYNGEGREIPQFLSIYGFKKDQFNEWLVSSIRNAPRIDLSNTNGIIQKILHEVYNNNEYDVYEELLKNNTLSVSELRRPIFAYMIYQLIINNVNFLEVGKIGVYLSFLNLLSKDAKHINDPSYKINLNEEFEYRNLLHSISALWMYERHQGKQGSLKKADICRVLDGENGLETDDEILNRYKDKRVTEIEFLSHSYFGENDNNLHFQHQSFAEILLAEYYLKVFIKYSLDKEFNVTEARAKLLLGTPTEQTIRFLIDLIILLKESTSQSNSSETLEKRKLLFPLLATLATEKNNNLFSNNLYYEWFNKHPINPHESSYPKELIENWAFDANKIDKILCLCKEILNSNNTYLLSKSIAKTSLYDNELTLLQNNSVHGLPIDFDKWLALLVGNKLCNDLSDKKNPILFNFKYSIDPKKLFELIKHATIRNVNENNIPDWGRSLFVGIDMNNINESISLFAILNGIDFSFSHLKGLDLSGCLLGDTKFDYTTLENVNFSHTYMWSTSFKNLVSVEDCKCWNCVIYGVMIPFELFPAKGRHNQKIYNRYSNQLLIPEDKELDKNKFALKGFSEVLSIAMDLFAYFYSKNEITIRKINQYMTFQSRSEQKEFIEQIKETARVVYLDE